MQTRTSSTHFRFILLVLFVVLFVFFIYTFLHEAGHALIGLLFGATLTEFNVNFWDFSAHVDMIGGELTRAQAAIQSVAGVSLPLLIWMLFISFVPRSPSFSLRVLRLLSSMMVLNTLLAWIIIPVLYVYRSAPASDDVTHFLQSSGIPPLLLTLLAITLYLLGWTYFLSRIERGKNEFLVFRTIDRETMMSGRRRTIPVMTGILTFGVICAILLNNSAAKNLLIKFSPPQDFAVVAEIDLSRQTYSAKTLAEFTVDKPAYIGVFIAVRNINTRYFDLSVIGPDGYSSVVMHGEGYRANRDGGLWEEILSPGTYQLVLTSNQSPGTAAIFLKTH
jgi:hypothetical protein